MSTLIQTMKDRVIAAMKSQNEIEKNILRVALAECSAIESSPTQGGKELSDQQVHKVFRKLIQSNTETIGYSSGDGKLKLEEENRILNEFLPQFLSREDIKQKLSSIADQIEVAKGGQAVGIAMKFFKTSGDSVDGNDVKSVVEEIQKLASVD